MKIPVEFVIRNGYAELKDIARYLGKSLPTIYRWAVLRRQFPRGFPHAVRQGKNWVVRWSDVEQWELGLMTRDEEKENGIERGRVGEGRIDYSDIFTSE